MPIELPVNPLRRRRVVWHDVPPPADGKEAFQRRGFSVDEAPCESSAFEDPTFARDCAAVIIDRNPEDFIAFTELLKALASLLDADCRVFVRVSDTAISFVRKAIERSRMPLFTLGPQFQPMPAVDLSVAVGGTWEHLANRLLEHPPSAAPFADLVPDLIDDDTTWDPLYTPLLRRAFWDCESVHLKQLHAGRSQAGVYKAYPKRRNAQVGPPVHMPYFLKVGPRGQILTEYRNYMERVDPYIPFHLGPQLLSDRCCLGASAGLIVGDFVDESEDLAQCARTGRAGPAISCLFNKTLAGWHQGPEARDVSAADTALGTTLGKFPRAHKDQMKRRITLASQLADRELLGLEELRELFNRYRPFPVRVGPIHGDLHAGNVFARSSEAVVIDFVAHSDRQPLLFDAASLEVSLLVDGFPNEDWPQPDGPSHGSAGGRDPLLDHTRQWMNLLSPLYGPEPFAGLHSRPAPESRYCWLQTCVRQIRVYARCFQLESRQYAVALSRALLFKATKDLEVPGPPEHRRAVAYVFGESMLRAALAPVGGQM